MQVILSRNYFIFLEILLLNALTKLNEVEICVLSQTALPSPPNEIPWENALVTNSFNLHYRFLRGLRLRSSAGTVCWSFHSSCGQAWAAANVPYTELLQPHPSPLTWHIFLALLPPAVRWLFCHPHATTKCLSVKICHKKLRFGVRFHISRTILLMDGKFPGRIVYFQTC